MLKHSVRGSNLNIRTEEVHRGVQGPKEGIVTMYKALDITISVEDSQYTMFNLLDRYPLTGANLFRAIDHNTFNQAYAPCGESIKIQDLSFDPTDFARKKSYEPTTHSFITLKVGGNTLLQTLPDAERLTLLHYACFKGNLEAVQTLCEKYPSLISKGTHVSSSVKSKLPIDYAEAMGHSDIVSLLKQKGSRDPENTFVEEIKRTEKEAAFQPNQNFLNQPKPKKSSDCLMM